MQKIHYKTTICWLTILLIWLPLRSFTQEIVEQQQAIRFSLPLNQMKVTSPHGWRIHPLTGKASFHQGVDLAGYHDPVYSIMDGIIKESGIHPFLGDFIMIAHGDLQSIYGHLSYSFVRTGQTVLAGQVVGITGSTGRTTGQHLHFSIRFCEKYIHPLLFLKGMMER